MEHSYIDYQYNHCLFLSIFVGIIDAVKFSRSLDSCRRSYDNSTPKCHELFRGPRRRSLSNIINVLHVSKPIPNFQFDCVPPVVNVAQRKPLGHLSAMLMHELGLNLRYNPLYTFFKRTRHQFLLLARDVIMSGQLTP